MRTTRRSEIDRLEGASGVVGADNESRGAGHCDRIVGQPQCLSEQGGKPTLTDDAATLLALDGLDAVDHGAVLSLAVGDTSTALLEVVLRVDAL